jgi:hypothetical protein
VPGVTKEKKNCRVKIVLKDASGKTIGRDISDHMFTIQPIVQLGSIEGMIGGDEFTTSSEIPKGIYFINN